MFVYLLWNDSKEKLYVKLKKPASFSPCSYRTTYIYIEKQLKISIPSHSLFVY